MPNVFHDIALPQVISYRSRKELSVLIDQFESDSGDKNVFVNNRVIFNYSARFAKRTFVQLAELRRFYYCRQHFPFRFSDPLDNTSSGEETFTAIDQPVILLNDKYYLAKRYGLSYRVIKLPNTATIIFADGGSPVSASVNGRSGRVTDYTPSGDFTWGGKFDVPVRFDSGFLPVYNEYEDIEVELGLSEVLDDLE